LRFGKTHNPVYGGEGGRQKVKWWQQKAEKGGVESAAL